jgi:predicted nucleic acid-binding protein
MGKKGNGQGSGGASEASGGAVVLDAGALIAFERAERRMAALFEEVIEEGEEILVPASVLAQVWRGGPRSARIARLMAGTISDALDEIRAKEVGERLGNRHKADIADAHVVCCAIERDAELLTTDRDDIEALIEPSERLMVVSI